VKTYDEVLASEVSGATVLRGQVAGQELKITEEFIVSRTSDLVKALVDCDPTNVDAVRVLVVGIKALRELHGYLMQAVAEGATTVQRLQEQANKSS
jgi:hypothetical protein